MSDSRIRECRIRECRSCKAPIVWLETPNGKKMPVDAAGVLPEHDRYLAGTHTSHFATCPQADAFRKPTGKR